MSSTIADPEARSQQHAVIGWRVLYTVALACLSSYSMAISWQAQFVSYPLFRSVGAEEFGEYHRAYSDSIPLVVIIPGFATFLAGAAFLWGRPRSVRRRAAAVVSIASVVSLLATVLWAIPRHDELDRAGQSDRTIDSLLDANLVRSLALTVATVTLFWIIIQLIGHRSTVDD